MREQASQTGNSGYILSCGYFHGDNGAGLGANHRTGWTGLVARTLELFSHLSPGERTQDFQDRASRPDDPGTICGEKERGKNLHSYRRVVRHLSERDVEGILAQSGLLPTEGAASWIGFEDEQIEITRSNWIP